MNIEELKRMAEAATNGPWKVDKWLGARSDDWCVAYDAGDKGRGLAVVNSVYGLADAKYIAAAHPAAVLELIRQRDELLGALSIFMEVIDRPPEANCSCHISPPCNDCVENSGLREAFSFADATIAKAESKT